jgi:hypothetical protein
MRLKDKLKLQPRASCQEKAKNVSRCMYPQKQFLPVSTLHRQARAFQKPWSHLLFLHPLLFFSMMDAAGDHQIEQKKCDTGRIEDLAS